MRCSALRPQAGVAADHLAQSKIGNLNPSFGLWADKKYVLWLKVSVRYASAVEVLDGEYYLVEKKLGR